jgi:hypothetical protein
VGLDGSAPAVVMGMTRFLRPLLASLAAPALVAGALAAAPSDALATDSHAPRGARADWLPSAEWVMSSWLPYDESRLDALLHTDREELSHWLDDRRSLADLARRRGGRDVDRLAGALVAPRRGHVSPATFRLLRRHARDTLTQPHLARHLLFHIFHTSALPAAAPKVFGMSPARFRVLRNHGMSPQRIAAHGRLPAAGLSARLDAFFAARARRAVATQATTGAQAAHLLALQRADLARFVHASYRTPSQQAIFACRLHTP